MESYILLFLQKGNLRITKNYRGITFTPVAVKIYKVWVPSMDQIELRDYYQYQIELLVLNSNNGNHLAVCKQMINIK